MKVKLALLSLLSVAVILVADVAAGPSKHKSRAAGKAAQAKDVVVVGKPLIVEMEAEGSQSWDLALEPGIYRISLFGGTTDLSWVLTAPEWVRPVAACDAGFDQYDEQCLVEIIKAETHQLTVDEWDGNDTKFEILVEAVPCGASN